MFKSLKVLFDAFVLTTYLYVVNIVCGININILTEIQLLIHNKGINVKLNISKQQYYLHKSYHMCEINC